MNTTVSPGQRFTVRNPCPVCGGHNGIDHSENGRCFGFLSEDGRYAHCTQTSHAGNLIPGKDGAYAHFLVESCRCGQTHVDPPVHESITQNGHSTRRKHPARRIRHLLRDRQGKALYVHRRDYFEDGSKRVWWEQLNGRTGLAGVRSVDLPLYGAHEFDGTADIVAVVEGEPPRDVLAELGIQALGTVTGAMVIPSDDALRPLLQTKRIVIWPDNDREGRQHAEKLGKRLIELGHPDVRVIGWADAPHKGDAADFVAAGGTTEDVQALIIDAKPFSAYFPDAAKDEVSSESKLRFKTAREVAASTPTTPEAIVESYVFVGGITDVSGKPKAAGKTTFLLEMAAAILDGKDFMGYRTQQSPIVYLTEQPPASFRQALERAGLAERDDFHVLFWHDTIGTAWLDIVIAARLKCKEVGAKVLMIDTAPQFAGLKGDAENNSGAALEVMQPLQEAAAADGLAIISTRHDRKSGGDVGDSARGSSAFTGAVDVVLSLRRAEGAARASIRHLHALSRFDDTPDLLVIELTDQGFVSLGTETAVAEAEARKATLKAAPTSEADALKEADLIEAAGVKRTNGRTAIDEHLKSGALTRIGEGKRGNPYRYWKPGIENEEKDSDDTQEVLSESNSEAGHCPDCGTAQPYGQTGRCVKCCLKATNGVAV